MPEMAFAVSRSMSARLLRNVVTFMHPQNSHSERISFLPPKTKYTTEEALARLRRLCAIQERCNTEVYEKLKNWGFWHRDIEQITGQLIVEGFLNEERFARAFARGKFRIKKWGRRKIVDHLKQKRVSAYNIKIGLTELEEEDYEGTIQQLITKKRSLLKESDPFTERTKIGNYLIRKGFEPEIVWRLLKEAAKK